MFQTAMGSVLVSIRRSDLQQKMPLCDAGISFPCLSNVQKLKKDGVVPGSGLGGSQAALHQYQFKTYIYIYICHM